MSAPELGCQPRRRDRGYFSPLWQPQECQGPVDHREGFPQNVAMQSDLDRERTALQVSLVAAAGLAALAVGWGWVAGSQVILLDGVYALIGMLLTWLSLKASAVAASTPTTRFPYGLDALVPLAIALQGFALFGTLAYAAVEAVRVILAGGGEVAAGSLLAYGAVSGVACWALWRFLSRADAHSDLLQAEARQWSAAAVFSLVVVIGALAALLVRWVGLAAVEPYVDSVLVLVGCVLLVPQPVVLVRSALTELLEGAPSATVQRPVREALVEVQRRHGLSEPTIRMTKSGRKLYVDAVFLVEPGRWYVDQQDAVRQEARAALVALPYDVHLALDLTTNPA